MLMSVQWKRIGEGVPFERKMLFYFGGALGASDCPTGFLTVVA